MDETNRETSEFVKMNKISYNIVAKGGNRMPKIEDNEYRYIDYEINHNTKQTLFHPIPNDNIQLDWNHISKFIYELTLQNPYHYDFYNKVGDLKQAYKINLQFDSNTWSYQITYKNFILTFGLLAPKIQNIEMQKELFSENRRRKCHERTIQLFSQNQKLVTGYVNDIEYPNMKTIHSWIEQTINSKEYVIDYVMNIVIAKEDYDVLMGVQKVNELQDSSIIETYHQSFLISGKLYCLAGQEIANEIKQKVLSNDIFSKI